jgi:myo-inositol-1(or 4)-monophosphatase
MLKPSRELETMVDAARAAGAGLMRHFRGRAALEVRLKGPADFVSTADLESERTLQARLLAAYPDHGFVAEEGAAGAAWAAGAPAKAAAGPAPRFIVDPLDGTANFVHGVPHFAVSIALEREGRMTAGLVYDVPKDEMFVAELGRGAWLGETRLSVSPDPDLSQALVATGIPHASSRHRHAGYLPMLAAMMREAAGIRRFAAAALDLAYVAAGRFAVFFELGLSSWDVAAGALLVREAGGRISEPDGGEDFLTSGNVLATNGRLHERALALLRGGESVSTIPPQRRDG